MINDLSALARAREHEIRRTVSVRQQNGYFLRSDPWSARRLMRLAASRLGSALIWAGQRLALHTMEESLQHGS